MLCTYVFHCKKFGGCDEISTDHLKTGFCSREFEKVWFQDLYSFHQLAWVHFKIWKNIYVLESFTRFDVSKTYLRLFFLEFFYQVPDSHDLIQFLSSHYRLVAACHCTSGTALAQLEIWHPEWRQFFMGYFTADAFEVDPVGFQNAVNAKYVQSDPRSYDLLRCWTQIDY